MTIAELIERLEEYRGCLARSARRENEPRHARKLI